MTTPRILALLLLLVLSTLTGCAATTLQSSTLPDGFAVRSLSKVDADTPFAVNRSGSIAAVTEGSLLIIDPTGGPGRSIAPAPPTTLSFSPAGDRLAAAFATPSQSVLHLFDLQGKLLAEAVIPARITALVWRSEKELLITALEVKKFRFGTELISSLYRWNLVSAPAATLLSDITIRPKVAADMPEATLYRTVNLALSPYGDEIAYLVLKDPPMFPPYLRVAVRHLETGAEREIAEIGIGSGGPAYAPDGESILVGDARSLTRRFSLTDRKESDGWPTPGDSLALSPSGSYLLLDGRLYQKGQEVTSFSQSTGSFLPDGSGMAISHQGTLFLVSGLNDAPPAGLPGDLTRLLELRRLRMLGLITDKEYKARKAKATAQ